MPTGRNLGCERTRDAGHCPVVTAPWGQPLEGRRHFRGHLNDFGGKMLSGGKRESRGRRSPAKLPGRCLQGEPVAGVSGDRWPARLDVTATPSPGSGEGRAGSLRTAGRGTFPRPPAGAQGRESWGPHIPLGSDLLRGLGRKSARPGAGGKVRDAESDGASGGAGGPGDSVSAAGFSLRAGAGDGGRVPAVCAEQDREAKLRPVSTGGAGRLGQPGGEDGEESSVWPSADAEAAPVCGSRCHRVAAADTAPAAPRPGQRRGSAGGRLRPSQGCWPGRPARPAPHALLGRDAAVCASNLVPPTPAATRGLLSMPCAFRRAQVHTQLHAHAHAHAHAGADTHLHAHAHAHTCTHTDTCTYLHADVHAHTRRSTRMRTDAHARAHIGTRTHLHTHAHTCTYLHADLHAHMQMHTHVHADAHTHTHTDADTHVATHTHTHAQFLCRHVCARACARGSGRGRERSSSLHLPRGRLRPHPGPVSPFPHSPAPHKDMCARPRPTAHPPHMLSQPFQPSPGSTRLGQQTVSGLRPPGCPQSPWGGLGRAADAQTPVRPAETG